MIGKCIRLIIIVFFVEKCSMRNIFDVMGGVDKSRDFFKVSPILSSGGKRIFTGAFRKQAHIILFTI